MGLLHDMANVLKFNFEIFPDESFSPEGKDCWKQVKKEFQEKYGFDEHKATLQIIQELGVHNRITEIISRMSFRNLPEIFSGNDWDLKTCEYSDLRVSPYGVLSLRDRIMDGRKRYVERANTDYDADVFDKSAGYAYKLEQQIFEHCKIMPEDINDEVVNPKIEDLKEFEI